MNLAVAVQSDPAIVEQLERLASTQLVLTIFVGLIGLGALAAGTAAWFLVRRTMAGLDRALQALAPRLDPLLTSATQLAANAEQVSATVKDRASDVFDTIEDLNERVRAGADAVEERVRQFGTVVDVVQTEAEELLLDAASTAHGLQAAAGMLRGDRAARLPGQMNGPPADTPEDEEEEEA